MHPYLWSVIWYVLFALFHSVTAHEVFKERLARLTSPFFVEHFWRLPYCLISCFLLYTLFVAEILSVESYQLVWIYPVWLKNILALVKLAGLVINYWAFVQLDYFEFWGLRQAYRGVRTLIKGEKWAPMPLAGVQRLEIKGIYHFCRHPALTGGLLFAMASQPYMMTFFYTGFYFVYMLIGAYYEERRLMVHFGDQYVQYRRDVGTFFPNSQQILRFFGLGAVRSPAAP